MLAKYKWIMEVLLSTPWSTLTNAAVPSGCHGQQTKVACHRP